jgi:hypothetical protein
VLIPVMFVAIIAIFVISFICWWIEFVVWILGWTPPPETNDRGEPLFTGSIQDFVSPSREWARRVGI